MRFIKGYTYIVKVNWRNPKTFTVLCNETANGRLKVKHEDGGFDLYSGQFTVLKTIKPKIKTYEIY
jgi:hypothetical protein